MKLDKKDAWQPFLHSFKSNIYLILILQSQDFTGLFLYIYSVYLVFF